MTQARHSALHAKPGDRLIVHAHRTGEHEREAEVIEAFGEGGAPPYLVRWEDGHVSRIYPSSDVSVQPVGGEKSASEE